MARHIPYVAAGVLHRPDRPDLPAVALDTPAWWSWLDDPTTRSFAFHDAVGSFTARKEQRQRGGAYWTAGPFHGSATSSPDGTTRCWADRATHLGRSGCRVWQDHQPGALAPAG